MNTVNVPFESFPAMDIVTRLPGRSGYVEITDADTVAFAFPSARYGHQWHAFSPGSVIAYARESGYCPIDELDRARKLGHPLHWFNPNGVMITSHKRPRETWVGLMFGERVKFEGRIFRVERAPNDNVALIDETEAANAEAKAKREAQAQG